MKSVFYTVSPQATLLLLPWILHTHPIMSKFKDDLRKLFHNALFEILPVVHKPVLIYPCLWHHRVTLGLAGPR